MEKLWPLKGKILTGKKRVLIDDTVYLPKEERGDQVQVKLDQEADASNANAPFERLLSVPELCLGYLRYLVKMAKTGSAVEDLETRDAMRDLCVDIKRAKKGATQWRGKIGKATAAVMRYKKLLIAQHQNAHPDVEITSKMFVISENELEAARAGLANAEAQFQKSFCNADAVRTFFRKELDFVVASVTLGRYMKKGVPKSLRGGAGPASPLTPEALRDLAALVRYADDTCVPLKNQEIADLASRIRDAEAESRRVETGEPQPPHIAPLHKTWVQWFRKRMKMLGVPLQTAPDSQDWLISASAAASVNPDIISPNQGAGSNVACIPTPVDLRTSVLELAGTNEERRGVVGSITQEKLTEQHCECEEEQREIEAEITKFDEQIAELDRQREAAREHLEKWKKRSERKEADITRTMLTYTRSLDVEHAVLDKVYTELEESPTEEVCRLIAAQLDTVANAERGEYGAMVSPFVGPFVSRRPVLETTNEAVRQIYNQAMERVAAAEATEKERRVKRRRTEEYDHTHV